MSYLTLRSVIPEISRNAMQAVCPAWMTRVGVRFRWTEATVTCSNIPLAMGPSLRESPTLTTPDFKVPAKTGPTFLTENISSI